VEIYNFAPCGLICSLCKETLKGCKGCRNGGGDQKCYQLNCCRKKAIAGCRECEDFPCDNGYFADPEWRGVIIGFARCVKEYGPEKFFSLVKSKFGNIIDYEEYLSITEQNIINMLCDTDM
jgi:hypothetical protein